MKKPKEKTILKFFEFIYDRHKIWHLKENLYRKYPWTKDKVLTTYKFCNVYRELDKCTIHLIKNVIENGNLNFSDKILNILIYRFFNVSYFYSSIMKPVHWNQWKWKLLEKVLDNKIKNYRLFNSAYMTFQMAVDKSYRKNDKRV